ncbi:MAG TPA: hypothetical protein VF177_02900 [Anaerolineae bacterium]
MAAISKSPSHKQAQQGREEVSRDRNPARWLVLGAVILAILAIFAGRTYLAQTGNPPSLFDLFDTITVAGSAVVLVAGYRRLTRADWLVGLGLGLFIGVQLPFATLFGFYPFFGVVHDSLQQALIRGTYTAVAALGGLVIMRSGGPVQVRLAAGAWRQALTAFAFGAAVGIPLAVLNTIANAWTQGRPFQWQSPLAAAIDALQPAIVEDFLYRLAFLGLLWIVLRHSWPRQQAVWLAGVLSLLVHAYSHFGDEFLTQPLATLVMGGAMGLIWGLPMTLLAIRRDLDSSVGFHWMQDFARFWAGF